MTSENKAGRYELLEEIGRGAMGVVWKGYDPTIGRTVAVKTMKLTEEGSGLPRPDLVMRFQTETRAAGLLTHPSIVVIYDAGEDTASGMFYITMEYIQGMSLQILLDKKQAFPIPRVMRIMEQACTGLAYAHQHNVVHRDVKPANLMLAPDDTLKITDFGMAKILQLGTTQTGQIVGTPSYMSPEQVKGKPIDGRSDIFSLGVVLYELVTGEKPFPGQNVTTVIYKIVHEEPISPLELDSSIHPGLNKVMEKALAKDPDDRYQTCLELLEDLRRYRDLGMRDMSKTVVVTGRSPFAPPPTPPPAPPIPKHESSGTLSGVPLDAAKASMTPPRPPVAAPPPPPPPPPRQEAKLPSPTIRSGTSLPPLPYTRPEPVPEKKNHVFLTIVLLALLGAGGYLLWPTVKQMMGTGAGEPAPAVETSAPATPPATEAPKEEAKAPETKPPEPAPAKAESKVEPAKKDDSSALKQRIEQRLERAGFGNRVQVEVDGNTVRLTGSLGPADKRKLLQAYRAVQGRTRLDDRIAVESSGENERPRTAAGLGEVEVLTDPGGAMAVLTGPDGKSQSHATPWRFEELPPGRYTLSITHPSYRPENRILELRAGRIKPVEIKLQAYLSGLTISSQPSGADVLINGEKQSKTTPLTVQLAPGSYRVSVQKAGFEGKETNVELKGESLQQLTVQLVERARGVGYVDVRSVPPGADILVDGTNTGRKTPSVLQLQPGTYTITLFLRDRGFQPLRKQVTVEPNKTLTLNEILPR